MAFRLKIQVVLLVALVVDLVFGLQHQHSSTAAPLLTTQHETLLSDFLRTEYDLLPPRPPRFGLSRASNRRKNTAENPPQGSLLQSSLPKQQSAPDDDSRRAQEALRRAHHRWRLAARARGRDPTRVAAAMTAAGMGSGGRESLLQEGDATTLGSASAAGAVAKSAEGLAAAATKAKAVARQTTAEPGGATFLEGWKDMITGGNVLQAIKGVGANMSRGTACHDAKTYSWTNLDVQPDCKDGAMWWVGRSGWGKNLLWGVHSNIRYIYSPPRYLLSTPHSDVAKKDVDYTPRICGGIQVPCTPEIQVDVLPSDIWNTHSGMYYSTGTQHDLCSGTTPVSTFLVYEVRIPARARIRLSVWGPIWRS